MTPTLAALSALFMLISGPAIAQYSTNDIAGQPFTTGCSRDHCYFALPVYITADPHNIDKVAADCANAQICRGAVVAAAAYAGLDPSTVNQALLAYGQAHTMLTANNDGNQHWIYFDAPGDFVFCNIAWHTWSEAGGSTVSGSFRLDRRQVVFYANVPVNGWLEGRSWTKTMVQLHAIRNGVEASCATPMFRLPNNWGDVMFDENGGSAFTGGTFINAN